MPRTTLTKTAAPGGYTDAGVVVAETAADVANMNQFILTENEVIVARNAGVGAQTVTITSTADPYNRTNDITAHSIAAGAIAVFGPFPAIGWKQADGMLYLQASSADIKFSIIKL